MMRQLYEEQESIIFENKHVRVVISKTDALVKSIFDKAAGREMKAEEAVYFFSMIDMNGKTVLPSGIALTGDVLTINSSLGSFTVECRVEEDYFTFEITSELPLQCYKARIVHAKYDYDAADKAVTGAVNISMTVSANPCFYPDARSLETRAEVVRELSDVGAKTALIIAPRPLHREIIKNVCRHIDRKKGIYSTTGGAFSTEHWPNYGDYTIQVESSREFIQENLSYFKTIGVEQVDFHKGSGTFRQGDFLPARYENAAEFKRNVSDALKANGMLASLHSYSAVIDYDCDTILSNPKWQKDFAHLEEFTLAEDINAEEKQIKTLESTAQVSTDFGFCVNNTPYLLIDEEIIQFIDTQNGFTAALRGACGTKAVPHKKGALIAHLDGRYHSINPVPGSELFYEVARKTARLFNEGGFDMIYLDAFEAFDHICRTEDEIWYYGASFLCELLRHCDHDPILEASSVWPFMWMVRGRFGAWDTCYRGYKNWNMLHAKENERFLDSYSTATLGWYDYYPLTENYPGNQHTKYQHLDAVDHMGTLSLVYNYSTVFNGMTPEMLERYPALLRNVERYRMYTGLRRSDYFSKEILEKVKRGKWEYHVKEKGNGAYAFVEKDYQSRKLYDLSDKNRKKANFQNPFNTQTPFIRIEALLSTLGENPMVLLPLDENRELKCQGLVHKFGSELNLSDKLAMKVSVSGNGKKGGAICIKTRCATNSELGVGEYIIDTDFEGKRDFILIESDNGERLEFPFDNAENRYAVFRSSLNCDRLTSIEVETTGNMTGVRMSSVTVCDHIYDVLKNPSIRIGEQKLTFECELMSSDFIEFDGSKAVVVDRYGNEKRVWSKGALEIPSGEFEVELDARSLNRCVPRAQLTFGFTGEELF